MLVLSRKKDQRIRIGDDVVIQILQTKGGTVKVGIKAPETVQIVRDELPARTEPKQESSDGVGTDAA